MRFKEMIVRNKMSLVVSLPCNDLKYAEAALECGAQAIKVHLNVWHRASNNTFGDFTANQDFMKDLLAICSDIPVGLVPGMDEQYITEKEYQQLETMGLGFFSNYAKDLPPFMLNSPTVDKMVAIDSAFDQATLEAIKHSPVDVLEASIIPGESYGKPLKYADVLKYSHIVSATQKPVLIPTQKRILPSELTILREVGCKAIMIGAVVMGNNGIEAFKNAIYDFRNAIEAL
jgi:hypothetical protein